MLHSGSVRPVGSPLMSLDSSSKVRLSLIILIRFCSTLIVARIPADLPKALSSRTGIDGPVLVELYRQLLVDASATLDMVRGHFGLAQLGEAVKFVGLLREACTDPVAFMAAAGLQGQLAHDEARLPPTPPPPPGSPPPDE